MRSLFKVYKNSNIILGEKETIKFGEKKNLQIQQNEIEASTEDSTSYNVDLEEIKAQKELILEEAEIKCQEIIQNAKKEAEIILEDAYNDSRNLYEKAKKDGYEEGYDEGFIKGKEEGYKEVENYIEDAKSIKQEAMREKNKLVKELEEQIVELVIQSIKKILNHEIEKNHSLLMNLIEKGLEKCTFTESLVIRVSEEDYELVHSSKNKIYMMTEGIDEIEVKSDASLPKGSVYIETLSGTIDSSIQTQIEQIETLFKELVKSE